MITNKTLRRILYIKTFKSSLKLLSLTLLIIPFIHCNSTQSTSDSRKESIENATVISAIDNETETATTTTGEVLVIGDEFVDFTETPTILFDNDPKNSSTLTNITTPILVNTTTIEESSNKKGEEEEGGSHEDEGENLDEIKEEPFNPPQNVSQYMDYIERLFHDLRHQITDLFEPHIPQLIRTSQMVQLSASCSYDMLKLALALRQFEPWALRMIDSSGKVPEGIFEGSFTALGSYDECLNTNFAPSTPEASSSSSSSINKNEEVTQGKYCLVNVSPYLPPKPPADKVERMFQEEANRRNYTKDDQFSRLSPMFYYMKFRIGVCIPSTCVDSDLESIATALSSSLRLNITIPHCKYKQNLPFSSHQLIGGFIFGLVLTIVLVSTILDYSKKRLERVKQRELFILDYTNHHHDNQRKETNPCNISLTIARKKDAVKCGDTKKSGEKKFAARLEENWAWMSFSLFTNYRLYFNSQGNKAQKSKNYQRQCDNENANENSETMINCLNGIRVISLCWVIIANSYITLDPRATKRLTKTREAPKDFLFQMVAQASLAIETFFFLSGVLMSLSFAKKLKALTIDGANMGQKGYLRWIHFYVHRYIRMTPATMLVIAFTMFAFHYGDGPLWLESTHKAHLSCGQNWWRHLLHVANFIDTRQMCFIHYWYIAADMQLFLFAPLLMFLIYKRRLIGYIIISLISLISIGNIFYTTYMRNLPPTLLFYNSDPESRREFGNTIMTKPLTHALPYMVGMLVGKWLTNHQQGEDSITKMNDREGLKRENGSLTTLFGLIAFLVALAEVFLPYKWNNSHLPTRFLASLYAALFRLAWSLALAYMVISCRHRRGKRCRDQDSGAEPCCSCTNSFIKQDLRTTTATTRRRKTESQEHNTNDNVYEEAVKVDEVGGGRRREMWCVCGSGGNVLNRLLSLSIFTHLSKLSFVAYLIHLPLMSVFIAQTRGLFAFSHTLVIHLALSYLLMTFILSFILVHIIEFPFITLEQYLFRRLLYSKKLKATRRKQIVGPLTTINVAGMNNAMQNGIEGGSGSTTMMMMMNCYGSEEASKCEGALKVEKNGAKEMSERL